MESQTLKQMLPQLKGWIDETLRAHASRARSVDSYAFPRLPDFCNRDLLATTKVIEVERLPVPPLSTLGLTEFAAFEEMAFGGITYLDSYFATRDAARLEQIHFHELVHVLQWEILGPDKFLLAYADGFLKYGYRDSPLEVMAYDLQARFDESEATFSVRSEVEAQLAGWM